MISDGPIDRLHHEQERAQVDALVDQALPRPAHGPGGLDGGGAWRLWPGNPGRVEAALLSVPGARPA